MTEPLLKIEDLNIGYFHNGKLVPVTEGVSFSLDVGKTLCIVGESGSGKTSIASAILRLIPKDQGRILKGRLRFKGNDLLSFSTDEMREIRGKEIALVIQDSLSALNPVFTIGNQLREAITTHEDLGTEKCDALAVQLLTQVGLNEPARRMKQYPHELSGGMRQRVLIAMALSHRPALLIADEPTASLDVTVQAQILSLLKSLQKEMGMAVLLITHDLGVAADMADDVLVLKDGHVIEQGSAQELFSHPQQAYTQALLKSAMTFQSTREMA
jgi:peptide/nickel transport system ATP-binding protein